MTTRTLLFLTFFSLTINGLAAQGSVFGIKGGLTMGTQKWNGFQQDPLLKWHGIASIESLDEEDNFSVFAQAGYHLKGSAIRGRNFFSPINGNIYRPPAPQFIFKNASLTLGGKKKYQFGEASKVFLLFGLRGDYTIGTNLKEYEPINDANGSLYFPDDEFVRNWNYGMTFGGGFEVPFTDLIGGVLEFTVNPDFSRQYFQPSIANVYNPYLGTNTTLPERSIRNITFEITAGFRFLRIVEYVD